MRCYICDYSESLGSSFANIRSTKKRRVNYDAKTDKYICNVCAGHSHETLKYIKSKDTYDKTENTPALPVREKF